MKQSQNQKPLGSVVIIKTTFPEEYPIQYLLKISLFKLSAKRVNLLMLLLDMVRFQTVYIVSIDTT